jgi:hypothetical protein
MTKIKNIDRIKRTKYQKTSAFLYNNTNFKRSVFERVYILSQNKFDGGIDYHVEN